MVDQSNMHDQHPAQPPRKMLPAWLKSSVWSWSASRHRRMHIIGSAEEHEQAKVPSKKVLSNNNKLVVQVIQSD